MIGLIISVAALFYWLMRETNWLKVNLYPTDLIVRAYARYNVYSGFKKRVTWHSDILRSGGNLPEGQSPNGEPVYDIWLHPGLDNVLCGWEWLDKHCAAMVDYKPEVYLSMANIRYTMTIKQSSILTDVMKANKMTRREKALAIA